MNIRPDRFAWRNMDAFQRFNWAIANFRPDIARQYAWSINSQFNPAWR